MCNIKWKIEYYIITKSNCSYACNELYNQSTDVNNIYRLKFVMEKWKYFKKMRERERKVSFYFEI